MPPTSIDEYELGWVCALPKEMTAARAVLDEEYGPFENQDAQDSNSYILGCLGEHNVVMACLPVGVYGTNAAARVAKNMTRTFTGIRYGLMVGIAGGIPDPGRGIDIRLGDVVVSQPDKTSPGLVQYDLRKNLGAGNLERKGFLEPPPTALLTALSSLQSQHGLDRSRVPSILAEMMEKNPNLQNLGYRHPGSDKDRLFCSHFGSVPNKNECAHCEDGMVRRSDRDNQDPVVHYGTIASGNELIKNAVERDRIGKEFNAKCVEMEAAGLTEFRCIVIRGICDYADAYKNDVWQEYAAATAAAVAKEYLSVLRPKTSVNARQNTSSSRKFSRLSVDLIPKFSAHRGQ